MASLSRGDATELLTDDKRPDIEGSGLRPGVEERLDQLANEFADGGLTASQVRTDRTA